MSNPLQPAKIIRSVSPLLNGKFELVSLARGTDKGDKLSTKANYIAVLPFERTADNKIKAIYCLKFYNHGNEQDDMSLIIDELDPDKDKTSFDAVGRALLEEAGLSLEDLNINEDNVYYLGFMSTSEPVSSRFKCYAVDLTKISRPDSEIQFARTLSKSAFTKDASDIVKIGFHQIVNGDYTDVTILAGSFLLVSYFS